MLKITERKMLFTLLLAALAAAFLPEFFKDRTDVTVSRTQPGSEVYFRIPADSASVKEFQYFFGLTKRRADKLAEARDKSKLGNVSDLDAVKGIPDDEKERIKKFLVFSGREGS